MNGLYVFIPCLFLFDESKGGEEQLTENATWYMEVAQKSQLLYYGFMSKNSVQVLAISLVQIVIIKLCCAKGICLHQTGGDC